MTKLNRRDFLKLGAAGLAAAAVEAEAQQEWRAGTEMRYRKLGRTGLKVSEVGFGGYAVRDPAVLHYALDRGINYIDTAPDYRNGASEEVIGRALKGRRKAVVLTTKWHPWAATKRAEMLTSLNASLKRLQTDYVDCLLVHQVGRASGGEGLERLENSEVYEAFELAKRQGKVRFTGVSAHDGDMIEVFDWVITKGCFDVLLMRYNFMRFPEQEALIQRAAAAGLGVIAMKALSGAKGEGDPKLYRRGGASYKQAALKWVLSNPKLSNLIITISTQSQVSEYAAASGAALVKDDQALLDYYLRTYADQVCLMCNECEAHCPAGLPVANILRAYMYYANYGEAERGRLAYAALPVEQQAKICLGCAAPCEAHCRTGVQIKRELSAAHLSLNRGGTLG